MRLRISTRDRRCGFARPIALIDSETNSVVSCHRSLSDGMRAQVLIEQVNLDRSFSAEELHALATETCERLFGTPRYERLSLGKFGSLINTLRADLLARRKR